jgi:hypothetical protein
VHGQLGFGVIVVGVEVEGFSGPGGVLRIGGDLAHGLVAGEALAAAELQGLGVDGPGSGSIHLLHLGLSPVVGGQGDHGGGAGGDAEGEVGFFVGQVVNGGHDWWWWRGSLSPDAHTVHHPLRVSEPAGGQFTNRYRSVHQLGDDPQLLGVAPDLAGLVGVIDRAAEAVTAPPAVKPGGLVCA